GRGDADAARQGEGGRDPGRHPERPARDALRAPRAAAVEVVPGRFARAARRRRAVPGRAGLREPRRVPAPHGEPPARDRPHPGLGRPHDSVAHPRREAGAGAVTRSVSEILDDWKARDISWVRFELPDIHGTARVKLVPLAAAYHYGEEGLNMYGGAQVLDSRSDVVPDSGYNNEYQYADQMLRPDPST